MTTASETFSKFIQQAPVAPRIDSGDLLALVVAAGVTKQLAPALLQASYSPTIVTSGTAYNVLPTDTFIAVNATVTTTILLLATTLGQRLIIADCSGNAALYPILVIPHPGDLIDGLTSMVLLTAWQSAGIQYVPGLALWKTF